MGSKNRAFLKNDPTTIGAGPAMCSSSERPILAGEILYEVNLPERYCKYDDEEKYSLAVTAHRVIQVSYQYRTVRIRCANGCERTLRYGSDECSRIKYWHTMEDARKELRRLIETYIESNLVEMKKYKDKDAHLRSLRNRTSTFNVVKLPAKVVDPCPAKA